jgi:hypothetical protein
MIVNLEIKTESNLSYKINQDKGYITMLLIAKVLSHPHQKLPKLTLECYTKDLGSDTC